jgi:hypothetical protein
VSESKDKEKAGASPSKVSAKVLFRRRSATVLYLVFLGLCLVATQAPWYQVLVADKPIGSVVSGPEFLRVTYEEPAGEPDPTDLFGKYRRTKVEHSVTPSNVAAACCLIALFVVVYNLFGDHDLQLPVFLLSLVIAGFAGYVVYRVWADNRIIEDALVGNDAAAELAPLGSATQTGAPSKTGAPGKTGAAPASAPAPKSSANRLPVWKPLWGYALFVSSALVLLLNATYLTLIAQRGEP